MFISNFRLENQIGRSLLYNQNFGCKAKFPCCSTLRSKTKKAAISIAEIAAKQLSYCRNKNDMTYSSVKHVKNASQLLGNLGFHEFQSNKRTITSLLRSLTSKATVGRHEWDDNLKKYVPRPIQKKKYRRLLFNSYGHFQELRSNEMFDDHFSRRGTYFYAGNENPKEEHTLGCFDIDCHKYGDVRKAELFVQKLSELFPGIYWELSTNERGWHIYFITWKNGLGAQVMNDIYGRLEFQVNRLVEEWGFQNDVEMVEVKGRLNNLVVNYVDGKPRLSDVEDENQNGHLIKFPRDASLEDLKGLPVLFAHDLLRLPPVPKRSARCGSVGNGPLDKMSEFPKFQAMAHRMAPESLATKNSSRAVAINDDFAVFLFLSWWFSENPNEDQSNPVARFEYWWQSISGRSFSAHRFQVIRDWASKRGLLHWIDETYTPGFGSEKGKAAKWAIAEKINDIIQEIAEEFARNESTAHTHTYLNVTTSLQISN